MCTVYEKLQSCMAFIKNHDKNSILMSALRRSDPALRRAINNTYCDAVMCVLNTCANINLGATVLPDNMLLLTGKVYVSRGRFYVLWTVTLDMELVLSVQPPHPQYAGIMYPAEGSDGERLYQDHKQEIDNLLRLAGGDVRRFLDHEYRDE